MAENCYTPALSLGSFMLICEMVVLGLRYNFSGFCHEAFYHLFIFVSETVTGLRLDGKRVNHFNFDGNLPRAELTAATS